jgi:hypothetical protein
MPKAIWPMIIREDGIRVELIDPKGCGHPSKLLSEALHPNSWKNWMGAHGCNGLCSSPEFTISEEYHSK